MMPSMRSIIGFGVREIDAVDEPAFKWPTTFTLRTSTVTMISFTESAVEVETFENFLAGIANLQYFNYHQCTGLYGRGESAEYQPRKLVELLTKYARESLVTLRLGAEQESFPYNKRAEYNMGSLQEFTRLRFVTADDTLFGTIALDEHSNVIQSTMDRLVDVLPKIIITLELHQYQGFEEARHLFHDLAVLKEEYLPWLNKISCHPRGVRTVGCASPLSDSSVAEPLRRVGIVTSTIPFPSSQ